ncbi:MAG: ribonuclease J, partial [Ketobacter sp.]|nr:ribonuclease J [Ketobacter sp.]
SDPMVGPTSDEETLSRYGDEGVLAMVCDSTNVFVEGESGSESGVRENLKNTINSCKQRVLVTTFASNIARLESIIYAGLDAGRSIALAGKSLWRVTSAAQESGYLQDIPPFLSDREAMDLPRDKVLILATGGQGEPRAALTKIARQEHPGIRLQPEDTVVFSSRVIPGNETKVGWLHNKLVNMGIEVITDHQAGIHVSGHPCREELERMYQLVRPHISVPVHGEARHIHEHAKLAKQLQVPYAVEATNGAVIQLEEHEAKIIGMVDSGYIAMDGITMMDTDSSIIRTRRKIRDQGCVVVSLLVDKQGKVVSLPKLSAPGCMDSDDDAALIRTICEDVMGVVNSHKSRKSDRLGDVIRAAIRRHLNRELGKKPVIDIHIHELKR